MYLAVYVESADIFLVEDVRDVIDRQWGERILSYEPFQVGQKTARVRILKDSQLTDELWQYMLNHHSMRIDGPSFRGRPLGHRLDPLRSKLKQMEPLEFEQLINRLLSIHRYEIKSNLDPACLLPDYSSKGDIVSLSYGTMYYTYEFVLQMTTEFGFEHIIREGIIEDTYCIEGQVNSVQGSCAVRIPVIKSRIQLILL